MLLNQVIEEIRDNIVSQLSFKEDDVGNTDNTETLIRFINRAIRQTNSDFELRQLNTVITIAGNSSAPDTLYSLPSDFVSAIEVSDVTGQELPINHTGRSDSVFIDELEKTIYIQFPEIGRDIGISYVAAMNEYTIADYNSGTKEFKYPIELMETFYQYIGYLANLSINPAMDADNNTYYLRYNAAVRTSKMGGSTTVEDYVIDRNLREKGFV